MYIRANGAPCLVLQNRPAALRSCGAEAQYGPGVQISVHAPPVPVLVPVRDFKPVAVYVASRGLAHYSSVSGEIGPHEETFRYFNSYETQSKHSGTSSALARLRAQRESSLSEGQHRRPRGAALERSMVLDGRDARVHTHHTNAHKTPRSLFFRLFLFRVSAPTLRSTSSSVVRQRTI